MSIFVAIISCFLRSVAIDSFFKRRAADSLKNYKTPLLSPRSPNYPLTFLEVEELKHLSSIYLTSTLD